MFPWSHRESTVVLTKCIYEPPDNRNIVMKTMVKVVYDVKDLVHDGQDKRSFNIYIFLSFQETLEQF